MVESLAKHLLVEVQVLVKAATGLGVASVGVLLIVEVSSTGLTSAERHIDWACEVLVSQLVAEETTAGDHAGHVVLLRVWQPRFEVKTVKEVRVRHHREADDTEVVGGIKSGGLSFAWLHAIHRLSDDAVGGCGGERRRVHGTGGTVPGTGGTGQA